MQTELPSKKIIRKVKIKDATLILEIPKGEAKDIKKEIRHRLDCESHNLDNGDIFYVYDDYEFEVNPRDDILEVIITTMDIDVRMNKFIPEQNIRSVTRKILKCSDSVIAVGGFEIKEHFTIEALT